MSANISSGLGKQANFVIDYQVTAASSAINQPVIVVDVNQTSVQQVYLSSLQSVTCPMRLTTNAGRKKLCFQDATLKSSDGLREVSGSVLFSNSITPSTTDTLIVQVIDTQEFANPNYVSVGLTAFQTGTENKNTQADIGASDSGTASVQFGG